MIIQSPSPTIDIPNISWPDYFLKRIEPYHDQPALIDGDSGQVTSFDKLKENIYFLANALQRKGYKKGDVFAIYAPNSPEYVFAFQGVQLLGGIITTINPLYTVNELTHQLNHSKAVCLFTTSDLQEKVNSSLETTSVQEVFIFNGKNTSHSFDFLLQDDSDREFKAASIDPERDVAVLPYSSGTTGLSKGVMLSHRNLVAHNIQIEAQRDASHPAKNEYMIAVLPFFHIFGMTVNMNLGLSNGSALVIVKRFDPSQFLGLI